MLLTFTIIALALVFDFLNGFHDSANSIATVVSTRVLSPRLAVAWAAFFNFIAAFSGSIGLFLTGWMGFAWLDKFFGGLGTHVAHSIASGVIDGGIVDSRLVLAALGGAIFWNLATWYYGLPVSSSHALVGGLIGSAMAKAGPAALIWTVPGKLKGIAWIIAFIFVAPVLGMALGFAIMLAIVWLFRRAAPGPMDRMFRRGQLLSAAFYSIGHGLNDAQKTMGIIVMTLLAASTAGTVARDSFFYLSPDAAKSGVPLWVVLICHTAIGMGTYFGGWRIVKTMGMKITRLQPVGGFAAETAAGITLMMSSYFGIPVSTTHTITGGIIGAGSTRRLSAVRWGVAGTIVWAWVLTIPLSAMVAWAIYWALFPLAGSH
jgi:PiT family inorganic phosphate transporter